MFASEVVCQQIRHDIRFASEPDTEQCRTDERNGRRSCKRKDEGPAGSQKKNEGLDSLRGKPVDQEPGAETPDNARAATHGERKRCGLAGDAVFGKHCRQIRDQAIFAER